MDAAVTRHTIDGANPDGWVPEERVTLAETLTAYTRGAAFAGFMEDRVGRIAPGMLADLVVLDRNLFETDAKSLVDARVDMTVVEGAVAWERPTGRGGD